MLNSTYFTLVISLLISTSTFCAKLRYPNFQKSNFSSTHLPDGWKILSQSAGDIDLDGNNDLVVIYESMEKHDEDRCELGDTSKTIARILVIYLYKSEEYVPLVQNNVFLARSNEGGMVTDLVPTIKIVKGYLKISYQYARSQASYDFKLKKDDLILKAAHHGGVTSAATGDTEFFFFNFEDSTIVSIKGNISTEENELVTQHFKLEYPMILKNMRCMYSWEILPDKFL